MADLAIRLEGITKQYLPPWQLLAFPRKRRTIQALDTISLAIPKGQICGLLGTNGAGKTTLIKILATLLLPDQGSAAIQGVDLLHNPLLVKQLVGLVTTNERSFYWRLSARENLLFFAALHGLRGSRKSQRVEALLELLELQKQRTQSFMTLSTGQRQRLALARALLVEPEVLLLDEPTTGLDPLAAASFKQFVQATLVQSQGKTVLWCTHNLAEAAQLCDRVVLLHQGRIMADLDRVSLQHRIDDHATCTVAMDAADAALFNQLQLPGAVVTRADSLCWATFQADALSVPRTLATMVQKGIRLHACTRGQESLEEVFARVTQSQGRGGP